MLQRTRTTVVHALVSWLVLCGTFLLTAWLLPGMSVTGGVPGLLWTTLLFSVVNLLLGGVLKSVAKPLVVVTFGLFLFVINMATLKATAVISSDLAIHGLDTLAWAAFIMALVGLGVRLVRRTRPAVPVPA